MLGELSLLRSNDAEEKRLAALHRYDILDTPPEEAFERVANIAAWAFKVPIVLVSLIDERRQWFKACHGVDLKQTDRSISICTHTLDTEGLLVVPDATQDPRFSQNPFVTGELRVRFYAGAPLVTPDGFKIGTLCVIDTTTRIDFSEKEQSILQSLADSVISELESRLALNEQIKLRQHNELLIAQAETAQSEILFRLARAVEYRDDTTGTHMGRVGAVAAGIAQEMGLSGVIVKLLEKTAPLHDVGKIAIADSLLQKTGKLTYEEFETIKTHTIIGAKILSGGQSPLVQMAEVIALTHHERWDGTGYPYGLSGEAIPLAGRIAAVADVLDALISERPYKRAWTLKAALAEIQARSGHHFDPQVVAALERFILRPFATLTHN